MRTGAVARRAARRPGASPPRLTLETRRDLQLTLRLVGSPQLLQELAEEIVGGLVVGVVLDGAAEHPLGRGRLPLLDVCASQKDVGSAVVRVDPDRALKGGGALVAVVPADLGVAA